MTQRGKRGLAAAAAGGMTTVVLDFLRENRVLPGEAVLLSIAASCLVCGVLYMVVDKLFIKHHEPHIGE